MRRGPGLHRSFLALALAVAFNVASARAQETLQVFEGQNAQERFGRSAAFVGDIDGDGFPDLLVGTDAERVDLFSGARGTLIRTHAGSAGQSYGFTVAALGDIDLDQIEDYAIGAPELGTVGPGFVEIRSGATGALIQTLTGAQNQDKFGSALARVADLDFDAADDLLVGSPSAQTGTAEVGRAEVFSTLSGVCIWQFEGVAQNDRFGAAVADAGDVDGDLIGDLAVGAPGANQPTGGFLSGTGAVTILSGWNGQIIRVENGDAADDLFGASLVAAGDIDADGVPDLAVGAPGVDLPGIANAGRVRFLSGGIGTQLYDRDGSSAQLRYGTRLASAGDYDGDGQVDIQIGSPNDSALVPGGGSLEVFSPVASALLARREGDVVFEQVGESLAPGRDLDGDGRSEIAITRTGAPSPVLSRGAVEIASPRPFLGPAAEGGFVLANGDVDALLLVDGAPGDAAGSRVEIAAGQAFTLEVRAPLGATTPRPFALFGAAVLPRLADAVEDPAVGALAFIPCPLLPSAQPLLFTVADGLFGGSCPAISNPGVTPWLRGVSGLPAGLRVALQGVLQRTDGSLATTNGLLLIVD